MVPPGNVRDPAKPVTRPGRTYALRSRVRCNGCRHWMRGVARPAEWHDKRTAAETWKGRITLALG